MIHGTRPMGTIALAFIAIFSAPGAGAESVVVKYRGPVDLARMSCEAITRTSFINRLCYDAKEKYVVLQLDATYYHYCDVPAHVIANWRAADSMGRYYNAVIKGNYDCRQVTCPTTEHERMTQGI